MASTGTTIANQGTIAFDGDANGTNESTAQTDDPATAGGASATTFVVAASAIPVLSPAGLLVLALALAAIGYAVRRRRLS